MALMKHSWTAEAIRSLRRRYGESQPVFCRRLGVVVDTLRLWEQDRGEPNGSAIVLLDILDEDIRAGQKRELQTA